MKIELDMYQTLALSVLVLLLGKFLRERVRVLENSASRLRSSAACCSPFYLCVLRYRRGRVRL